MDSLENIILTDILPPTTVHSAAGKHLQMRHRKTYGLSLCIRGQITYTMGGKNYVSDPGCAVLLPKGGCYTLHGDKDGLFPLINFDCRGLALEEILILPLKSNQSCIQDLDALGEMFLFNESKLQIFSAFYALLNKIRLEQQPGSDRLSPVIRYIESNIADPDLSNSKLCRYAGVSEVHLRRLFSARYNTTPKQYILNIRIRKAKQLLCDSPMTVTSVSEACGFSSLYHFCRAFKKSTGSTPTQYARGNRNYRI